MNWSYERAEGRQWHFGYAPQLGLDGLLPVPERVHVGGLERLSWVGTWVELLKCRIA